MIRDWMTSRPALLLSGATSIFIGIIIAMILLTSYRDRTVDLARAIERRDSLASRRADRRVMEDRLAAAKTRVDEDRSSVHATSEEEAASMALTSIRAIVEPYRPVNLSLTLAPRRSSPSRNMVPIDISFSVGQAEAVPLLTALEAMEPHIDVTKLRLDAARVEQTGMVRIEAELQVRRIFLSEAIGARQ